MIDELEKYLRSIVDFMERHGKKISIVLIMLAMIHTGMFMVVSSLIPYKPEIKDNLFIKIILAYPTLWGAYIVSIIFYLVTGFLPELWRINEAAQRVHSQMTEVVGQMGKMIERLERLPDQIPIRLLTSMDEILREITLAASVCETVTFLGNCEGDYIVAIKASQNQKLTGVICDTAPDRDSFDKVRSLDGMLYRFLPVLSPTDFGLDIFVFRGANRQPRSLLVFRVPDPNRVSAVWLPGDVCELIGLRTDNFPKISMEMQINQQIPHIRGALKIIREDLLLKVTDGYWHPVILLSGPDFWEEQIFRTFVDTASHFLRDGTITQLDITWDFTNLSTLKKADEFEHWFSVLNSPNRACYVRRIIFVSSRQWIDDKYRDLAMSVYNKYIVPGMSNNYDVRVINVDYRHFDRAKAKDVAVFRRERKGDPIWVQDSTYFSWGQLMERQGIQIDPNLHERRVLLIYFYEETDPQIQKLFEAWWSDASLNGARYNSLEEFDKAIKGGSA
jgi:hypothetical protein